ncbi:hypothetical protein E2C01_007238 [Portunus trituberculatus]|uniref:Uncharacterized protein n=1 Tax=Portunus trituberculatus TaxID=210409 RepID=A0A5B7CZZ1_PORTR|nr:hypothetical protein [Portunus trituberculatus]
MSLTTGDAQGCRVMAEVEQWQALWEAQMLHKKKTMITATFKRQYVLALSTGNLRTLQYLRGIILEGHALGLKDKHAPHTTSAAEFVGYGIKVCILDQP